MELKTHRRISSDLCGEVTAMGTNTAEVALQTTAGMAVDAEGLVHGGFVFGLADFAAMAAVNHPWVVLAGAESRFLQPVRVGDRLVANAVSDGDGRRPQVAVEVARGRDRVARFTFDCAVLGRHVLKKPADA